MQFIHARLYATADGQSHFEDISADLVPTDFAPPAPPLDLSALRPGIGVRFMGAPPGGSESHIRRHDGS
jgi:hypothetical protein